MAGNGFGKLAVGGGCERDAAAGSFLPMKKIKNLLPIGKTGGVEMDSGGELVFEGSSAGKQPERKQQQRDGAGPEECQNALPKHIPSDQSAVEIDTQDRGWRLGG